MNETQKSLFIEPEQVVKELGIVPGTVIADFGCGSGFFSLAFANAVGNGGKVYAFDVLPQAIESVMLRSRDAGFHNIEARRVDLETKNGTKLSNELVDVVFMKDVLYQSKNRSELLAEARRILKANGRLEAAEWRETSDSSIGPDKSLRLSQMEIEELFEQAGFLIIAQKDLGEHHMIVTASKK